MKYYMAPMEGITDSIYRRLHHKYFPGVDRYYTPFFSPTVHRALSPRESRELPIANTIDVQVIPQLLTKVPEDFIWMTGVCKELGYTEVNLNLGCPSGTVTAKSKGAGMLREPSLLQNFLDNIFSNTALPISVKTRLCFDNRDEFYSLLDIYNQYPIVELTIHPRLRKDFYTGNIDMDMFDFAVHNSQSPLCYNGNLCSNNQIIQFSKAYPQIQAVMLGRGLVGNPGMLTPGGTDVQVLANFLDELMEEYAVNFGRARNAMFRLKENWRYLFCLFEQDMKLQKRLRKATTIQEYKSVTHEILYNLPMRSELSADW
jgi:tRNA-dihydrouridine synthase